MEEESKEEMSMDISGWFDESLLPTLEEFDFDIGL